MSDVDNNFEHRKLANEAAVNNANIALRTLVLINGGAAIALLAFIGTIVTSPSLSQAGSIATLTLPLLWFGGGVVATVMAMIFAYVTHYCAVAIGSAENSKKMSESHRLRKVKTWVHFAGILATLSSLGLFVWGLVEVREAIITLLA